MRVFFLTMRFLLSALLLVCGSITECPVSSANAESGCQNAIQPMCLGVADALQDDAGDLNAPDPLGDSGGHALFNGDQSFAYEEVLPLRPFVWVPRREHRCQDRKNSDDEAPDAVS